MNITDQFFPTFYQKKISYLIGLLRHTYLAWCCRQRNDPGCFDGEHTHCFIEPSSPARSPPPRAWPATTTTGSSPATVSTTIWTSRNTQHLVYKGKNPSWHIFLLSSLWNLDLIYIWLFVFHFTWPIKQFNLKKNNICGSYEIV